MLLNFTDTHILTRHPATLYSELDTEFSAQDWLGWEIETLMRNLPAATNPRAEDKIPAVHAVAKNSNRACTEAIAFEKVINAFSNVPCVVDALQPPYIEEVMYDVLQMEKIVRSVHGTNTEVVFTGEVPGYVASVAKYHSWTMLPKPFAFAQGLLDFLGGGQSRLPEGVKDGFDGLIDTLDSVNFVAGVADAVGSIDSSVVESPYGKMVLRIIGCYVFDPTVSERSS